MLDVPFRSARQLAADIKRKKIGCLELLDLYLARVEKYDGYTGVSFLPSSAAPCGFTPSRLPVGVQIVGPQYGDLTCLAFARLLEREFQPFVPPPGYA